MSQYLDNKVVTFWGKCYNIRRKGLQYNFCIGFTNKEIVNVRAQQQQISVTSLKRLKERNWVYLKERTAR